MKVNIYLVLLGFLFLFAVVCEHAFGLTGLMFVVSILVFQPQHPVLFLIFTTITGCIADVLYLLPFGTTAFILNGCVFLWSIVHQSSRMRFVFYMTLGFLSSLLLSFIRQVPFQIPVVFGVLLSGWLLGKYLYMHRLTSLTLVDREEL